MEAKHSANLEAKLGSKVEVEKEVKRSTKM